MPPPPDTLLAPTERLSDRLAERLRGHIDSGEWPPGHRLPTEQKLTEQFGVSRTVVREAVSRLKSMGLLTSRQGAGMFVSPRHQARALAFDPTVLHSLEAVLHMVEVRRTLEGEVAGLAAERIDQAGAQAIQQALVELDAAVARGEDGVEQDLLFHRTIAKATHNPHFERLLDFLEQYQREAIKVTRTNESMKADFMRQVKAEHRKPLVVMTPKSLLRHTGGNPMFLLETLRAAIEACPFHFKGERVTITISMGLATFRAGEHSDLVLKRADQALYRAKNGGRNRVELG